jgi:hypothetical protein
MVLYLKRNEFSVSIYMRVLMLFVFACAPH